jgi:hypothetical protein
VLQVVVAEPEERGGCFRTGVCSKL